MKRNKVWYLQDRLTRAGYMPGAVDGVLGPQTLAAIDRAGVVPAYWPAERKAVGAFQAYLSAAGMDVGPIDGRYGPQTDAAWMALRGKIPTDTRPDGGWPVVDSGALARIYGKPGSHQVRVASPYPLRIAWQTDKTIRSFQCHEAVRDAASAAMADVLEYYGADQIRDMGLDLFGGCYSHRNVRGGHRLSAHSWGIAIDWDPAHNRLRWGRKRAAFARPSCRPWLHIWEHHGFLNLGNAKNYDWMHHRFAGGEARQGESMPIQALEQAA